MEAELLQHDSISLGSGDVPTVAATGHWSDLVCDVAWPTFDQGKGQTTSGTGHEQKDVSPSGSTVPATSVRTGFLRRRNVVEAGSEPSTSQQAEIAIASGKVKKRGILLARKDVEIESGVGGARGYDSFNCSAHRSLKGCR